MKTSAAVHLKRLLDLAKAWKDDRDTNSRQALSKNNEPGALAPVLWEQLEDFLRSLGDPSASLLANEKKALVQLYNREISPGSGNSNLGYAINALERSIAANAPSQFIDRLHKTMLSIGCWPDITHERKQPNNLRPQGPYAVEVDRATEHSQAETLRMLLDWEGSGPQSVGFLGARQTGRGLSAPFLSNQSTGWAWAVRNTSDECLKIWLEAGADPNAVDKRGWPVLAYVTKKQSLAAMLDAGADPLNPALPLAGRRVSLTALWHAWSSALYWRGSPGREDEWERGVAYLEKRLAQWSDDDIRQTRDVLLFSQYFSEWKPNQWSKDFSGINSLIARLARKDSVESTDEVVINGKAWTLAGATCREMLLTVSDADAPIRLPVVGGHREIVPGIQENFLKDILELPLEPVAAQKAVVRWGAPGVAAVFEFLFHEASESSSLNLSSLLFKRFDRVLTLGREQGDSWHEELLPAVEAFFAVTTGTWPKAAESLFFTAQNLLTGLRWLHHHQAVVPIEMQARWAALGLGAYIDNGASDNGAAELETAGKILVRAVAKGWDPESLATSEPQLMGKVFRYHPHLSEQIKAARLEVSLEKALPIPEAQPRSRPRM